MRIASMDIKNFRLLRDVRMTLDSETTVVVGRNNSGKTSLTELLRRVLVESRPTFQLEDFSLSTHDQFWTAFVSYKNGGDENDVRGLIPCIQLRVTIEFDDSVSDFGPLRDFVIDLSPDSHEAIMLVNFAVGDGRIPALFQDLDFDASGDVSVQREVVMKELRERVPRLFVCSLEAIDPTDDSNRMALDVQRLRAVLGVGFITAQRGLDDTQFRDREVLGRVIVALFEASQSESASSGQPNVSDELKEVVRLMQEEIGGQFSENLQSLMPTFQMFGYPGLADPGLRTETTISVDGLLTNTRIRYTGANGVTLPESFNGLGTRNLIYILLKLLEFYKTFIAQPVAPSVQLVFIEEPEAHLHPQMQEVFIRQLNHVAEIFAREFGSDQAWPIQFVVTSHSPHLSNEAPFASMRYFIATPDDEAGGPCSTTIKDLSLGLGGVPEDDQVFLHKYMTLTRCDLLFADCAVLIEGASERLLFPKIIEKVDVDLAPDRKLSSRYVSIVEVGGAYAHRFRQLLTFLELRTLIISDIDSINSSDGRRACMVSQGTGTSNGCLKSWFGEPEISIEELLSKSPSQKIDVNQRLAYQIPEVDRMVCGRTFEPAFILANPDLFEISTLPAAEQELEVWNRAARIKKTDFGLQYAIDEDNWKVPRYMVEGLAWLSESGAVSPEPRVLPSDESNEVIAALEGSV
jgi:putative ATP-dependent endonuclease of OLD family